jgi:hypothetical protein
VTPVRRAPALLFLGAILVLGGCGAIRGPIPQRPRLPEAETPAQSACLEQARSSEPVQDLERQRNPQNIPNWERLAEEATARINRAYRDCLRREGLALPGGVEAARPR